MRTACYILINLFIFISSQQVFSSTYNDYDGDGILDYLDNCPLLANPEQIDADGDGFGNRCDADLNNDGAVNFGDLGIMKSVFFTSDPYADLSGDGAVNFLDLGIMKSLFFLPPGPGASNPPPTFQFADHRQGDPANPVLGSQTGTALGSSAVYIDTDGDGNKDYLVLGQPDGGLQVGADLFGGLQGKVEIYCLNPGSLPTLCLTLHPPYNGAYDFGAHLAVGNFDGDGQDKEDLVISDPKYTTGGHETGRLSVIYADDLSTLIQAGGSFDVNSPRASYFDLVQTVRIPFTTINNRFGNNIDVLVQSGMDHLLVQASSYPNTSTQSVFYFTDLSSWNQDEPGLNNNDLPSRVSNGGSGEFFGSGDTFRDAIAVLNENAILIGAGGDSNSRGIVRGYYQNGTTLSQGSVVQNGVSSGTFYGYSIYAADVNCDGIKDGVINHQTPILGTEVFGSIGYHNGTTSSLPQWETSSISTRPRIMFENDAQPTSNPAAMLQGFRAAGAKLNPSDACESIAISVPRYDVDGNVDQGAVWIITGSDQVGEVLFDYQNDLNTYRIEVDNIPLGADDQIGAGFVLWGDYDLDGDQDLLIGSKFAQGSRGGVSFIENTTGESW